MSVITGNVKRFNNLNIDFLVIFSWRTGENIAVITPQSNGNWEFTFSTSLEVGITYIANGCNPITHGPYLLEGTWSPLLLFTPTSTGVWYDPSDLTTLFKDDARKNPVTKSGDIVRVMLDKSGAGNHARCGIPYFPAPTFATTTGMRYRTNGTLHWLEPHNNGSGFIADGVLTDSLGYSSFFALNYNVLSEEDSIYFMQGDYSNRVYLYATRSVDNLRQGIIHDADFVNSDGVLNINPHLYTVIYDSSIASITARVDSLADSVLTGVVNHTAQGKAVNLFRRGLRYNGKFYGGIMVDNYIATSNDRTNINTYLSGKSGIVI